MRFRALSAALIFASAPVLAGNLLTNPGFDTDLSGWESGEHSQWQTPDAFGIAGSGSLIGSNDSETPSTIDALAASPCLLLVPGASYDGSFDYRIAAGQGRTAVLYFEIKHYGAGGCSVANGLANTVFIQGNLADGAWHRSEAPGGAPAPAGAVYARIYLHLVKVEAGGVVTAEVDNVVFKTAGTCGATPDRLCVNHDRFQVTANYENYAGQSGIARAKSMTGDTGYFWFFSPSNVEVVIKVINGCAANSNYWIYAGGLTDVEVALEVKDMQTGTTAPFHNNLGTPFQPIGVIGDLPVCP